MKQCLLSDVVLAHPNYTKDFHLFTDASNCGLGAYLMQADDNGQLKPLMYFSKSINIAQKRYSTTKKEFLAIYEALREFFFSLFCGTIIALSTRTIVRCHIYLNESYQAIAQWLDGALR